MIILATTELTGWPLAIVLCTVAICFASAMMEKWPWQK
jgi:hypothetical protein